MQDPKSYLFFEKLQKEVGKKTRILGVLQLYWVGSHSAGKNDRGYLVYLGIVRLQPGNKRLSLCKM